MAVAAREAAAGVVVVGLAVVGVMVASELAHCLQCPMHMCMPCPAEPLVRSVLSLLLFKRMCNKASVQCPNS